MRLNRKNKTDGGIGRRMAICLLATFPLWGMRGNAQPLVRSGEVDVFVGVDLNYRDIFLSKPYELLINLTPGVKWNLGRQWQVAAQALLPVYNDYGDYYKRVRLNLAVLSKEWYFGEKLFLKGSGGLFSHERYGLDAKLFYTVNPWLALEAQAGWTGFGLGGKHAGPVDGTGGSRRVPGPLEYAAQGTGRTLPVRGLWRGGGRNAAFYALQRGLVRTVQQRGRTERRIQGGGDDTALPAQAPEGQYPAGLEFPPDV